MTKVQEEIVRRPESACKWHDARRTPGGSEVAEELPTEPNFT